MDGKLVGRLSPGIHLTCRLSVTPRDGPAPVFVDKTVTKNGTYRATDEGADYFISLGGVVGTRFRAMFSAQDTSIAVERVAGKTVINVSNPIPYAYVIFTPESDGFITISKDNAGTANLKTYIFHLVDLIDGNN